MTFYTRVVPLPLLTIALLAIAQAGCTAKSSSTYELTQNKYVTKENFEKIKPGMTYTELQEIFGDMGAVQPITSAGDKDFDETPGSGIRANREGLKIVKWANGRAWIKVRLDDEKVVEKRAKGLE
jgi:hypothetical protein